MGAVHVWAIGTFGTMTLAVMTRASRGHSGQPLAAGRLEVAIYGLVLLGALARVAAPYLPGGIGRGLEFAGLPGLRFGLWPDAAPAASAPGMTGNRQHRLPPGHGLRRAGR
jgi:hypothetical protein